MRILLVNKFFFLKGGADRHFFALKELLERNGHTVIPFSMQHPQNLPSPYERYFVSNVDFERVRFDWQGVRAVGRMLWSFEAQRKLEALIHEEKPDIAHLHNIYHQISPSILPILKKHRIPIVQTLHDFKLISPNYNLSAHGGICTHALGGHSFACVPHRCIKNSYAASFVEAIEMSIHKSLRLYERYVDVFLAPSRFLQSMMTRYDRAIKDIRYLPLFVEAQKATTVSDHAYGLFVGRLSEEKGIADLVTAAASLPFTFKIVGEGPLMSSLRERLRREQITNVELCGYQTGAALETLYANARCVIVPSRCYENFPLAVLEAYTFGKPVVATDHGGLKELVTDGVTGLRFAPGSSASLRAALVRMMEDPAAAQTMGQNGQRLVAEYTPEVFIKKLLLLYEMLRAHAA